MFKGDTRRFTVNEFLYDRDGFAVASGIWHEDNDHSVSGIALRWVGGPDPKDIGYPQTYAKPQWLILPNKIGLVFKIVMDIISTLKWFK